MKNQINIRSNYETFIQWCDECTFKYGMCGGHLGIIGHRGYLFDSNAFLSKGNEFNNGGIGTDMRRLTKFYEVSEIDSLLSKLGYYGKSGKVAFGGNYYRAGTIDAPTMKYGEWINKNYPTDFSDLVKNDISNIDTFYEWIDECAEGFDHDLGRSGSEGCGDEIGEDGICVGGVFCPFDKPQAIDVALEYMWVYKDCWVNIGRFFSPAPTMKYSEWFKKTYENAKN